MTALPAAPAVIVVGGGVAGLVTAWELARAGRAPLVLEAGPTAGGAVARHVVGGLELDAGAESYAAATPAVPQLLAELGLAAGVVAPNPVGAWVRHAGGSAPLPAFTLLGIPARPFAPDVRRVLGVPGAARAVLDRWLPASVGGGPRTSLGGLVGRRMGRAVVDRLVDPVAGGVYSTDPDELDIDAVQPRLRKALRDNGSLAGAVSALRGTAARPGSAVGGLAGGMFGMVAALTDQITAFGGAVATGVRVDDLQHNGWGWLLQTTAGPMSAGQVVLAVPGPAATALLNRLTIAVPTGSADTSDVLLVTLVVSGAVLDAHPRGTGVLVSRHARGVRAKALTQATAKWAWLAERAGVGRHVLRLSYGRGADPLPSTDGLVPLALGDAAELTGVPLRELKLFDSAVVRWTSALPRPQPGSRAATDALRRAVSRQRGLHLTGSLVAGTGLAAVVADARVTAAAVLAQEAATQPAPDVS